MTFSSTNEGLFENWVQIQSNTHQNQSIEFKNFELQETQDEWLNVVAPELKANAKVELERLKRYAAGEQLAHHLAYQDLTALPTALIPLQEVQSTPTTLVREDDGSLNEYAVRALKTNVEGLTAFALVPNGPTNQAVTDIKIIFRGTSSAAGALRDLELGGAGNESFAAARNLLISQVNDIVKEVSENPNNQQKPIRLTTAGHSLGGADGQNFVAATIDALAQNQGLTLAENHNTPQNGIPSLSRNYLARITTLRLFTFNSAGITKATADRTAIMAEFLAERREKGYAVPNIESFNMRVGGDGVQQTGETHLFSNVPSHHAEVDVLKAHIGSEQHHRIGLPTAALAVGTGIALSGGVGALVTGGAVLASSVAGIANTNTAHRTHLFRTPISASYEAYSNATPHGQKLVHDELNNKSLWLNRIHAGAHTIGSSLSSGFRRLTSLLGRNKTESLVSAGTPALRFTTNQTVETTVVAKPTMAAPVPEANKRRRFWLF